MTTGLQAGDDLAAKGATAPRVSLKDMEDRIARVEYFTAGEAVAYFTLNGPLPDDHAFHRLTICVIELDNGWTLLGKSAPASADNFDESKGRTFAYEDALRQLWPLEGYLLRNDLFLAQFKDGSYE